MILQTNKKRIILQNNLFGSGFDCWYWKFKNTHSNKGYSIKINGVRVWLEVWFLDGPRTLWLYVHLMNWTKKVYWLWGDFGSIFLGTNILFDQISVVALFIFVIWKSQIVVMLSILIFFSHFFPCSILSILLDPHA